MDTEQVIFFEGRFVPAAEAKVSVMTHALNYGTGCFEGIRGYVTSTGDVAIFRLREHMRRLLQSSHIIGCAVPYGVDELCALAVDLVRRNDHRSDLYIRPIVYKSGIGIGVKMMGVSDDLTMFSVPFGKYLENSGGIRCAISSWRRSTDNNIPPRAKITGGYINAALAKNEALLNGFDEAIMLTDAGFVSEGSAENLFIVRDGVLHTPSISDNVLEGITRHTMITLADVELGVRAVERAINRTELYTCDELFLCGTGAEVIPVIEVDRRPVGAGKMGPLTQKLRQAYFSTVKGENARFAHWLTPVYGGAAASAASRQG